MLFVIMCVAGIGIEVVQHVNIVIVEWLYCDCRLRLKLRLYEMILLRW